MKEVGKLQAEIMEKILHGGAWFTTRRERFVKIEYSEIDGCYFARECNLKDDSLEAFAYSFGTDWFDISIRGPHIDIYSDPDTFKTWEIWYERGTGTMFNSAYKATEIGKRMIEFCREADREVLSEINEPYEISGTNFDLLANR